MARPTARLAINGREHEAEIEPRKLLSDFIREEAGLTGTHVGCEHGVCGACTVMLNGETVRSCLMFAIQAEGAEVRTVESLAGPAGLSPLQESFWTRHGLQCGFCTPGILMTATELLENSEGPLSDETIREAIGGNLCRCTGYQNVVAAIRDAAVRRAADSVASSTPAELKS